MSKKSKIMDGPPDIANMSAAQIRSFMESSAKNGQIRIDAENQRIAHAAAKEICSVFDVRVPEGTAHANRPQTTIEIIIVEQIKYRGHAR